MRLLLDTHVFLWYVADSPRLTARMREAIDRPGAEVAISLITLWEVALKHAKGRLELIEPPDVFFASEMLKNGFTLLPLKPSHVFTAAALPQNEHRDPFDRALAAQSLVEEMFLVSADAKLDRYGIHRID